MREPRFLMRIWDLPTRMTTIALMLLAGGDMVGVWGHRPDLSLYCCTALLPVLLFRLLWGIMGSDTARFRPALHGPVAVIRQIGQSGRRAPDDWIGHSPAGGWMILAMLLLLAAVTVTRLLAEPSRVWSGPWAHRLTEPQATKLAIWHARLLAGLMVGAGVAVLWMLVCGMVKKQNLLRPAITGQKRLPGRLRAPRIANPFLGLALLLFSVVLGWILLTRI